jgi:hypothetical protein
VAALAPVLGLTGTVGGYELRQIVGLLAGLMAWNFCRSQPERLDASYKPYVFGLVAVLAVLAIYGSMRQPHSEGKPVKLLTQTRLDNLQVAMTAIQGAVVAQNVPFPETPEQILTIIRANRPLFPSSFRMAGAELFKDEWGNAIRYEHHGGMQYTLRSAGPDKVFGTKDDLIVANREPESLPSQGSFDPLRGK